MLFSRELNVTVSAPPLSFDDQFNSNPGVGLIAYRLPSMSTLFNMPEEKFDSFASMTFELRVRVPDYLGEEAVFYCP